VARIFALTGLSDAGFVYESADGALGERSGSAVQLGD
jgi:hypothetical protein